MRVYWTAGGLLALGLTLGITPAEARDLFVYPERDQTAQQQEQDEFSCYQWAKRESGVDPGAPPKDDGRGRVGMGALGGAVKGGAVGAGVGAIAGGSKGAKKGAAIGGALGGVSGAGGAQADQRRAQEAQRSAYRRAFSACMEARGYVVR
jgi:hypothetical protein